MGSTGRACVAHSRPVVTFGTCVSVRCHDRLFVLMLWCLLRLGDCLLYRGSGEVFAPNYFHLHQLFDHWHSGRSRGFRHSGGRATTHQVLGSSSELVDTAKARRQQRVEDAARVGLRFPFRRERRDRVLGMPLSSLVGYIAPVTLKCKRDKSAQPKTDRAKRTYRRIPDEAKVWFKDFHAYQSRVDRKTFAYNFAGRSSWYQSSSTPWHPSHSAGGMTAAHVTSVEDRP